MASSKESSYSDSDYYSQDGEEFDLIVIDADKENYNDFAETVWLSDMLWVNVRTGPTDNNRVLKTIKSGTRMEVLEKAEDGDYYHVRTENGLAPSNSA